MMAQNILTAFDAWLNTWSSDGGDPTQPDIGQVQVTSTVAANDPIPAPDSMIFRDLAERPGKVPATIASAPVGVTWRSLADEYYRHHFGCLYCIAAGQNPFLNRCAVGGPLWQTYQTAVTTIKQETQHHDGCSDSQ